MYVSIRITAHPHRAFETTYQGQYLHSTLYSALRLNRPTGTLRCSLIKDPYTIKNNRVRAVSFGMGIMFAFVSKCRKMSRTVFFTDNHHMDENEYCCTKKQYGTSNQTIKTTNRKRTKFPKSNTFPSCVCSSI